MESFLWALNLVAVCLLCLWAIREDSRPPVEDETAGEEPARAEPAKTEPGAPARSQGRQQLPRK